MFGRLIVVSNLAGVPSRHENAQADGLAVAMRRVLKRHPGIWFGWSGSQASGEVHSTRAYRHAGVYYVVTDLTQEDHDEYYNGFANRVLWPVLHYRLDLAEFSRRDLTGYLRVNHHFANELHKLLQPDDLIWVHDYHLLPLARMLRERGHRNRIGFFLHVPFPPPEILTALPNHEHLIPGMADYDVLGFQTENDTDNFVRYLTPPSSSAVPSCMTKIRQKSSDGRPLADIGGYSAQTQHGYCRQRVRPTSIRRGGRGPDVALFAPARPSRRPRHCIPLGWSKRTPCHRSPRCHQPTTG